ncbi:General transcription factor II-I repeat domain-containing protein 2 [Eumeta japonica]|uniref:General transcription factor II-I repeat domain-containing protein 2 n=1 Tax=Eumeta variegata TaxID=151549 RepID=A0A4C1Z2P1_EUMVA|nr:General transcription factor II-I repeat domain-containing protein 2 [Eumeta japonica]
MLKRLYELRNEIADFMQIKNKSLFELSDPKWICDLTFLVDLKGYLNDLNLKLNQLLDDFYSHSKAFPKKIRLWEAQILSGNSYHFTTLSAYENVAYAQNADELNIALVKNLISKVLRSQHFVEYIIDRRQSEVKVIKWNFPSERRAGVPRSPPELGYRRLKPIRNNLIAEWQITLGAPALSAARAPRRRAARALNILEVSDLNYNLGRKLKRGEREANIHQMRLSPARPPAPARLHSNLRISHILHRS